MTLLAVVAELVLEKLLSAFAVVFLLAEIVRSGNFMSFLILCFKVSVTEFSSVVLDGVLDVEIDPVSEISPDTADAVDCEFETWMLGVVVVAIVLEIELVVDIESR